MKFKTKSALLLLILLSSLNLLAAARAALNKQVFFLDETHGIFHPGNPSYDSPHRLIPTTKVKISLETFLKTTLNEESPTVRAVLSRHYTAKASAPIFKSLQKLLPECPIEDLYTYHRSFTDSSHVVFHPTDTLRESPISPGTISAVLSNTILIAQLAKHLCTEREAVDRDFLIRPPGHHGCDEVRGFCVINNAVLTQRSILSNDPTKRIAIIDLDMHYGDGIPQPAKELSKNTVMLNLFNKDVYPLVQRFLIRI